MVAEKIEHSHSTLLHYQVSKRTRLSWYSNTDFLCNCVNNNRLEHEWLLKALTYGLIGCFSSKLSNLTCLITNISNGTGQIRQLNSQYKINHFMLLTNKL